jgi:hypothetical protein
MSKEEDEAFTALLEERTRMGAWRASCAQEEGGQENGGQEDEEGSVPAITPGLPQSERGQDQGGVLGDSWPRSLRFSGKIPSKSLIA